MPQKAEIDAIIFRLAEIADEIKQLQKESDELGVALRVFRRFSPPTGSVNPKLGPPRPEGTPTLFEMTETVIRSAEQRGEGGLLGREIVEEIGNLYWFGVRGPQILPSIYQFVKRKRLKKDKKGRFSTVFKNETSDVGASDVSGDEGGASSSFERQGKS